jgi:hypothetical protein
MRQFQISNHQQTIELEEKILVKINKPLPIPFQQIQDS